MKPLENITIVEFSTMITASFATMMLAEQGARAIKVEPIDAGDPKKWLQFDIVIQQGMVHETIWKNEKQSGIQHRQVDVLALAGPFSV